MPFTVNSGRGSFYYQGRFFYLAILITIPEPLIKLNVDLLLQTKNSKWNSNKAIVIVFRQDKHPDDCTALLRIAVQGTSLALKKKAR